MSKPDTSHTIEELDELLSRIMEKFHWLGDYL